MGVASMIDSCPGAQIKQIIVRTDVDPSPWILVQLILHMKHSHAHACNHLHTHSCVGIQCTSWTAACTHTPTWLLGCFVFFLYTVCHSEMNAIISGFRREADLSGCTLYVTYSPCPGCCKVIAQAGIKRVEFAKYYDNCTAGYESLQRLPGMNIT